MKHTMKKRTIRGYHKPVKIPNVSKEVKGKQPLPSRENTNYDVSNLGQKHY